MPLDPPEGPVEGPSSRRPALRTGDLFRAHGPAYAAAHGLTPAQHKVLRALGACRTVALGGHLEVCDQCGFQRPAYNACRDRHCPSCLIGAQRDWLAKRLLRVVPTHHFHVVFTLPEELRPLALRNGAVVYDLLLRAAADVLDTLGRQRLGAQLGVTTVLHTWTRAMLFHPHVHCVVTGGGLTPDGQRWVPTARHFLFPVAVLRKLFRGAVRTGLRRATDAGKLDLGGACADLAEPRAFARLLRSLHRKRWVVYAKPPFAGPEAVFAYLGRYTHRVAISDHRLLAVDKSAVTFKTKFGERVTVTPDEFIRRFLLHVLPAGFHKIRHTGLYASSNVHTRLVAAHALLGQGPKAPPQPAPELPSNAESALRDVADRSCPCCGKGVLVRLEVPRPPRRPNLPPPAAQDTS